MARPKKDITRIIQSVRLIPDHIALVKKLGEGSFTKGIEKLIERFCIASKNK